MVVRRGRVERVVMWSKRPQWGRVGAGRREICVGVVAGVLVLVLVLVRGPGGKHRALVPEAVRGCSARPLREGPVVGPWLLVLGGGDSRTVGLVAGLWRRGISWVSPLPP